ncbi:stage III sporulation protein AE [Alkaliphilus peptidifermentans]|uniref:Stage III sporulation protein AE n=1 Tax=Alkaliphilus peptidifermentans DSM 18978 TaxID=1120976 RepID=A0A1G5KEW0_9FIRM|nr:stage III sporulation protein AE [Alkaliphilus peptidifermentans]SCY98608.1 stage III sporulation protein AE [Alkaliphilus peptidifermentans DSM 18978]
MKKAIISLILVIMSISFAWGDTGSINPENLIINQFDGLETQEMQQIMNSINKDLGEYLPKIEFRQLIIKLIRGEVTFSFNDIIKGATQYLFKEVVANWKLMTQIIVLSSIYAILSNLHNAFDNDVVSKLAYNVCYLVIITITIKSFLIAINLGRDAIDMMVSFMQALLPVLLAILLAMGGITTSAFFHPILLGAIGLIGTIIKNIILPLIFFSAVLAIVNNLTTNIQVSKLAGLIKQTAAVMLGFILTAFVGLISIQGITAATVDGVTIRTAKFAVDKFIPIVGSFLSDAMDTVIGCSLLLKNAVGAIGLITIFLICLSPMIKILALIVIYKLCAAVIEPIAQNQLVDCLNQMSNSLILLFATVSSVAIMFFITITIIVGTGNITLMMR